MRACVVALLMLFAVSAARAGETCDRGHELMAREDYMPAMVALTTCLITLDMDDRERALVYTERARSFYRTGQYAQALPDYEAALALTPDDSMAWVRRANTRLQLGDHRGAFDDFAEALRLDPRNAIAHGDLGNLLNAVGAFQQSVDAYDRAIALDPTIAHFWNGRGFARMQMQEYAGAVRDLDEALRLDPTNVLAWGNRGKSQTWLGRYDEGIADLSRCIDLDPAAVRCYVTRAEAFSELGRQERALVDLDAAAKMAPADVEMLRIRARVHLRRADFDLAMRDYESIMSSDRASCCYASRIAEDLLFVGGRPEEALPYALYAVEGEPEDAWDRNILGDVYTRLGREDEALAAYDAFFELGGAWAVRNKQETLAALGIYGGPVDGVLRPELREALAACVREQCLLQLTEATHVQDTSGGDADANGNADCRQGQDYMNAYRFDAATESFTACIENGGLQGPALGYAHYLRAMSYRWNRAPQRALADLDRAVALAPDEQLLFTERANIHSMLGNPAAAAADLGIALAIAPADPSLYLLRSAALRQLGRTDAALADAEQAIALDDNDPLAHYRRAVILMDAGRYDEALVGLDTVIAGAPDFPFPYGARAWSRYKTGQDLEGALQDVARASALQQAPDWSVLDVEAHVLAALGRADEAVTAFEAVIAMVGPALVLEYQKGLAAAGYLPAPGDGTYDEATRTALRACVRDACTMWVERPF